MKKDHKENNNVKTMKRAMAMGTFLACRAVFKDTTWTQRGVDEKQLCYW